MATTCMTGVVLRAPQLVLKLGDLVEHGFAKKLRLDVSLREHLRDLSDREVLIHYLHSLRRASTVRPARNTRATLGKALELLETS